MDQPTIDAAPGQLFTGREMVGRTARIVCADGSTFPRATIRGYGDATGVLTFTGDAGRGTENTALDVVDLREGSRIIPGIPRAPSMTVRVPNRGTTRSYEGVWITRVILVKTCPRCGGPRGNSVGYRFAEDGEWYGADQWTNPCGHLDAFGAVLLEAAVHALPPGLPILTAARRASFSRPV